MSKTVKNLIAMKAQGEKIAVLTAYDASFTHHLEQAGVDVILVGDSLGMVIQGHDTTLPVTIDDMVYHTRNVSRVRENALLIADMSYHSYTTKEQALENAQRLINEAGADMVKLEGGQAIIPVIEYLLQHGIAVCGHLGLLPQSVKELGGYKVQGRDTESAEKILADAQALSDTGVELLVLECIPQSLAKTITETVDVITIGIGAGVDCHGQVLVLYDVLGITPGHRPRFSRDFLTGLGKDKSVYDAVKAFVNEVKSGSFPDQAHSFD